MADKNSPKMGKMHMETEKPKNLWKTVKRLTSYMKKSKMLIVFTLIVAAIGTIMQVLSPKMLGNATTIVFEGFKNGHIDFETLQRILLTVAALYIGAFLMAFLSQRFMTLVSQKTTYALRGELKAKMNRVPVSYFDKNSTGNLMSVAVNDIDNIATNLQQSLMDLIYSVILVIGTLWIMLTISPVLTLIAFIMIPGSLIVMRTLSPKMKKYSKAYYTSLGALSGQIEETFQGFTVVKSFNGEDPALKKFDGVNSDMCKTGWKARFIGGMMYPCMILVQNIVYVMIAVIGCVKVVAGTITIGDIQAFLQYSNQYSRPLMQITQVWSNILSMAVSADRVFDMLDSDEMTEYPKNFLNKEESAKVVFEHVKFGYDKPLLTDFSLDVREGQMTAIVGHTGAGKTTLINLLERFYEIQDGSLRIDGVDVRNESRQALRSKIGMVLQDTWLFAGSIYDNIKYGNENATDEQIHAAAKAAYAEDFIQKLPEGYDTVLNEGAENISQGQRQLITIARAFVSNPDILILDEATSNVDSRTELIIQHAMKSLLKGRTSFVVAHRLSTIYDADRILVMDDGDIVETGTHGELLEKQGVYADIYNSQFMHEVA